MEKKVVLLTGSSRGIGRAIALRLAQEGHKVYATMRNPIPFEEGMSNITVKRLDVQDKGSVQQAVSEIIAAEQRLDVVINNAGSALFGPVEMATDDEIQQQFDVNVFGLLRVIKAVLPQMRQQRSGHIINISSIAGLVSNIGMGIYCATKHAVEALSSSLAATVFPWNIKVTVVEPGPVDTEFCERMAVGERLQENNPYKKFSDRYQARMVELLKEGQPPEEIAELISKIIASENPDCRYQTSPRLTEMAKELVVDPTGNAWVEDQKDKFGDWFENG